MKTINPTENINNFLDQIINTDEDIKVNLLADANAHDLIAISNALQKHSFRTVAKINGISSIIPLIGADNIEMAEDDFIFIKPLTCSVAGSKEEQQQVIKLLKQMTDTVVNMLHKWPKAQELFKKGHEVFLNKEDAKKLNISNFTET